MWDRHVTDMHIERSSKKLTGRELLSFISKYMLGENSYLFGKNHVLIHV